MEPEEIMNIKQQAISNAVDTLQNYKGDKPYIRNMIDKFSPDMQDMKKIGTTTAYKNMVKDGDTKLRVQHKIKTNIDKIGKQIKGD